MPERIRQPITKGAARFVIVNTDFLGDLAPQLLSEGKVILMMPAEMAGSNARYRMPYAALLPEHEELQALPRQRMLHWYLLHCRIVPDP